ncbi:SWIM zinc finger family protein [Aquihabitans sp. McL0605]|uniref:SWIM zinc finger family protein n=1 Tax=Aquihabitans sp. McL0605 TaxID=3415671 RepID=UPI003CFB6512
MAAVRQFGSTWWGRAWVDALEGRAKLDPNRLARGRTYARQDRVARVEVGPGKITALVRGNRALPYKVTIDVPTYGDDDWVRLAAVIAKRSGIAAALLDGELDPAVIDDAEAAGVRLLPGPGDLKPRCSCPDWADPCKHAAAVCYLVADALDADPFVLFTLRGGTKEGLMGLVRAQRAWDAQQAAAGDRPGAAGSGSSEAPAVGPGGTGRMVAAAFGGGAVVDPGMVAREAWARSLAPHPERRELPRAPGTPSTWPADPPRDAPFTAAGLTDLASDAARRAWAQLAEGSPSYLDLDEQTDLARRAADRLGRLESLLELSRRVGASSAQLTHQALAWRSAGPAGLEAIEEALWRPPTEVIDQGLDAFDEAGIDPDDVQVRSNRLTSGDVQLRVSSDGQWWRFERRGRVWELVEPPAPTPSDLLSGG